MKRITLLVVLMALFGFTSESFGAAYKIKKGDTLTKISRLTDHTIYQLAAMNGIENPGSFHSGVTLAP